MKKFIYIAIIAILGSFAVTSCTEENIKPAPSIGNEGGHLTSDPLKG
jgi:hypothetical protein